VAYFNGSNSITSEGGFIYDSSTNRLGVNTSVPNATIGANASTDSGYSLLLKNGDSNYNSIGFATDSTYGNMITADRLGSAPSRNLTLYNYAGYISLTEAGNLGVGLLTPNTGIDIYHSTISSLWLHTATSGTSGTDGVRLSLNSSNNAVLRNNEGSLSMSSESDFYVITLGAENIRVNSANGYVGIGNPSTLPSMLTVNGGATITGLTTGQILFPTSGGTLSGSSNLFWNNSNTELSIGTSTSANRRLTIFSSSDANHLSLISNVPAITFSSNSSYTYYAGIGMATANNNFITGAVAGDLVLGTFNTNNIWFINNNTNTTRMRLDSDGGGTFSGFVSASGPKSQIRVNGNSVGCGISLSHTIVGANRRNWGIFTEQDVEGDFVIKRSNSSGGSAESGTTILSILNTGSASFSGNLGINTSTPDILGYGTKTFGILGVGSDFPNMQIGIPGTSASTTDVMGDINFYSRNGTGAVVSRSLIRSGLDGATNSNYFNFFTMNAGTLAERMRITSGGDVCIGATSYSGVGGSTVGLEVAGNTAQFLLNNTSYNHFTIYSASDSNIYNVFGTSGNLLFGTGNKDTSSWSEKMRILSGGNVGIGDTGDANQRLRVVGSNTGTSAFGIVVANSTGASTMFVRNDGYGYLLASAWAYGSDLRMKENISDVENGLDMVLKMKPKHFDYIDGVKDNIGFIAQDIQEIIPQAVSISEESTGMLALKTDFLIPYLVKAIQEQQAQIEELKALINK
jgi:hypothetical protein